MTTESDHREEAATVNRSGLPETARFTNARTAIAVYKRLMQNNESAAVARANIQGAYDGNPPYSKTQLKRHGIEWMTNIDWGEFRAAINRNVSSVWNMFNAVPSLVNLVQKKPSRDPFAPRHEWGTVIATEYTRAIRAWTGYHYVTRTRLTDMFKFGIGWCYWPDSRDWRSRYIRTGNVLFEVSTRADVGELKLVVTRDEMQLDDLIRQISQPEDVVSEAGWNLPYLRKKLVEIFLDGKRQEFAKKYGIVDWESAALAIKNNDFLQDVSELDPLRLVNMICVAPDGKKVQHLIFIDGDDEEKPQFIYDDNQAVYSGTWQFIQPIMFSSGDGYMASIRGLGREIFHFAHASNRLMNSILTGVDIASGLVLQGSTQGGLERQSIMKAGPITRIPQNLTLVQQQYMPNIRSAADAREIIQALQNNNTGMYKNRFENSHARTAEEVRIESANEARFESDQSEWYYVQQECWHKETFKRLMRKDYREDEPGYREHRALMDRLDALGVPEEYRDPDAWDVTATRAIGMGSPSQRLMFTNEMIGMSARLDERGRRNVDKDWFAARTGGYENVHRFVDDESRDAVPTLDHSIAESENVDMLSGNLRTVTVDDAHKLHLDMHLRFLGDVTERVRGGQISPEAAHQAMFIAIQHARGHIAMMLQDKTRKGLADRYASMLVEYEKFVMQLKQVVERNARERQKLQEEQQKKLQEAEQIQASREFELEKYKIDQQTVLEKYKADQLNEARVSKSLAAIQANQIRLENEIEVMRTSMAAEIERKAAETAAKIEMERSKRESA